MEMAHSTEGTTLEAKDFLFIQKIKKTTENLHLHLESQALLSAMMTPFVTRLQYYYYLRLMKKIEQVYEREILTQLVSTFAEFKLRKTLQNISDDLYDIGSTLPQDFVIKDYIIPDENISVPFALGFMYVMEGSKLGGKVIYKHIHRTLGYSEDCGAKYITDYGTNTFSLWKEFLSKFSDYVTQNDCEEEAIQGAKYAFSSIYDFFELNKALYEI